MPTFQSNFQRSILDGRLALWMLAALPLVFRGVIVVLPITEDPSSYDASTLGMLIVVIAGVRLYTFVAALLLQSTTQAKHRDAGWYAHRYETAGSALVVGYLYLTAYLPLWLAISIDAVAVMLIVRHGEKYAADILGSVVRSTWPR